MSENTNITETQDTQQNSKKKKGCCGGCLLKCLLILLIIGFISNGISTVTTSISTKTNTSPVSAVAPTNTPNTKPTATPTAEPTNTPPPHIYDNAEIRDVHSGTGAIIGNFSLIRVESSKCTIEALTDWYYNHVAVNNYNWCMIIYTDSTDNLGVYAVSGIIQKDVVFENDNYNQYYVGNTSNATHYIPSNGILTEL